jgi:hypothetical protein
MTPTPLLTRIKERSEPSICPACGSTDPRPITHKTWCSVRILEPSLHRAKVFYAGAFVPDDSGGAA